MQRYAVRRLWCALGLLLTISATACRMMPLGLHEAAATPTVVASLHASTVTLAADSLAATPGWTAAPTPGPSATVMPTTSTTVTATPGLWRRLEQATLPARDDRALAVEFRRADEALLEMAEVEARTERLGDAARFWIEDADTGVARMITATLCVQAEWVQMWVEQGARVDQPDLARSAELFDRTIYPTVCDLLGSEASRGIGAASRLVVLNAYFTGASGYFSGANLLPRVVNPTSNERAMVMMNLHDLRPGTDTYDSVLTHEFQHLLHWTLDSDEDGWLQEGASALAQDVLECVWSEQVAVSFFAEPDVQLNAWTDQPAKIFAHYGASFAFVRYLYDRWGSASLQALLQDSRNGLDSVEAAARRAGVDGVDALFADWLVANAVNDASLADGRYGYAELGLRLNPHKVVGSEGLWDSSAVQQYGVKAYALDASAWAGQEAHIAFVGESVTRLAPSDPTSGSQMWTSLWSDNGHATLERTFDLRHVSSAVLSYNVWHDIEAGWDYAYVRVSDDGGASWQLLRGAHMSDYNPTGAALGPGYTGLSGDAHDGPVWVHEELDLSSWCGGMVLVRFDYLTDDAYTRAGICLDDLAIEAIGWADDVEAGEGDWRAQGFVRHDNALPQRWLLQWVTQGSQDVDVTRLTVDATGSEEWAVPVRPDARAVWLLVSATTPWSRTPAPYQLEISAVPAIGG